MDVHLTMRFEQFCRW